MVYLSVQLFIGNHLSRVVHITWCTFYILHKIHHIATRCPSTYCFQKVTCEQNFICFLATGDGKLKFYYLISSGIIFIQKKLYNNYHMLFIKQTMGSHQKRCSSDYKCKTCPNKTFSCISSLGRHIKTIHETATLSQHIYPSNKCCWSSKKFSHWRARL